MRFKHFRAALLGAAALGAVSTAAAAQETIFLSTQLRPVEEATKVRQLVLKGSPAPVNFVVEEPSPFQTRMDAETQAGKRTISMVGALHGELQPLVGSKGLDAVDDLVARRASAACRTACWRWASSAATSRCTFPGCRPPT
jgi:multiple sugar transport system substrate-binding protein